MRNFNAAYLRLTGQQSEVRALLESALVACAGMGSVSWPDLELIGEACETFLNEPDVTLSADFPCGAMVY